MLNLVTQEKWYNSMAGNTILLIEDEERTAHLMRLQLENAGYKCLHAIDGLEALQLAEEAQPDLILLDLNLPALDGMRVCQKLRTYSAVPIIMVTARISDNDIVSGLQQGADDYLRKPIKIPELLARIETNLRRVEHRVVQHQKVKLGIFNFNIEHLVCYRNEQKIKLSTRQFQILYYLAQHHGQVLSREQIIDAVYQGDFDSYNRAIDIQISRIRKLIEPTDEHYHIQSVYGAGYRFRVE